MLTTKRLILRSWKEEDFKPFATMNANPLVMENFPKPLSEEESNHLATRFQEKIEQLGYGFWAAELKESGEFIGFIGLNYLTKDSPPLPFTPAVEVGWRLDPKYWGLGLATEGAKEALRYTFETLMLKEVVAMATIQNTKSHAVMKRLGMTYNPEDDFENTKLEVNHPLKKCVLYRIKKHDFESI
jgi:RimJ/RimL family protein N-acetyltransferase